MMHLPTRISKITGPRGVSKMRGFPPVAFKVDLQGSQLWVDTKFLVEPWHFTVFSGSTGHFQETVFLKQWHPLTITSFSSKILRSCSPQEANMMPIRT